MEISKLWCSDSHRKAKIFKYQRSLLSPECAVELVEYISLMSLPFLFGAKKFLGEKKTAYSCQTTYLSVNKKVTFWGGVRGKIWHVASKKPQDHALFFHNIYIRTVRITCCLHYWFRLNYSMVRLGRTICTVNLISAPDQPGMKRN